MGLANLAKLVKNAVKEKPIEVEFLSDLHETMSRIDYLERRKPSLSYKPSSLGGCKRNMFFQVSGFKQDDSKREFNNIGITENGSSRHETLQTWVSRMKEVGFDCEWVDVAAFIEQRKPVGTIVVQKQGMETKCKNEILNISFLCDGIIKYKGKYYILEIKTEDHYKALTRLAPEPKHIVQAATYSVCLGIDSVIFLYENRNYLTKKTFLVEVTEEMKHNLVVCEIEEVEEYRRKGTVPPKSEDNSNCTYCNYKKECAKW